MIRFPNETVLSLGGPSRCQIAAGQLHLWQIPLVDSPGPMGLLEACLTDAERHRADGFLLAGQSRRFTICRAAVRQILGRYASLPPQDVLIDVRPDGKPHLARCRQGADLRFNLSHSGDLALLVVGASVEVGVDLEQLRQIVSFDRMVERCLERTEQEQVMNCPPADRVRQFLRFWTHKEAYLKTLGVGLRRRLKDVVVDLMAPAYWRIVTHGELYPEESVVSLAEVSVGTSFVGAVAWASADEFSLSTFTWEGHR